MYIMELPKRKSTRIPGFDYSTPNYYFLTLCTKDRQCIFGNPGILNRNGKIAEQMLLKIPEIYPQVKVDKYVVMPNHVHLILVLELEQQISITHIIGQYKMSETKEIRKNCPNFHVWQRSFHDHIIRNQKSYEKIWEYIENNPQKWEEDCFFIN